MSETTHDSPTPLVRATIADGTITLNPWSPSLIRLGPCRAQLDALAERDVVLADLTFLLTDEGEEVVVSFVPFETATPEAEAAIERWASLVGYRRVWFPGRVAELEGEATLEPASVECPTCGITWTDSGPEFWEMVRTHGWFPGSCTACGGSLPEWQVRPQPGGGGEPATRRSYPAMATED